jgi:voltage-gated potassium channel
MASATSEPVGAHRPRYRRFVARHEVVWELSFAALALLFVLIGVVPAEEATWVIPVEWALTLVFAAEFFSRLWAAGSRRAYVRGHWIDVVALVPPTRGLRVLRLLRLLRLIRAFAGFARGFSAMARLARHRGLIWLLAAWVGVMVLTSMALYIAENGTNELVNSPFDALWWGVTTMTTVGYGDIVPRTLEGKIAAVVLMLLGIGLFSAVTAIITSFALRSESAEPDRDPIGLIARLGELNAAGHLPDDEFAAKRAELLREV